MLDLVSSHTRPWDGFPFTPSETRDVKQAIAVLSDLWVHHNKTSVSVQGPDQILIPSNGDPMCADLGGKKNEPEGRAAKVLNELQPEDLGPSPAPPWIGYMMLGKSHQLPEPAFQRL